MKRKIVITYEWWRGIHEGVKPSHVEALEESATAHINTMLAEEFTSGELIDNINMDDDDPKDGEEYLGWWSATTKNID